MTTITPQAFHATLAKAQAVSIDNGPLLTSWDTSEVTGDPDNQIVHFSWSDDDGSEYSAIFTEGGISNATVAEDGTLHCEDHEGEQCTISLYTLQQLKPQ